jgi:ribonucleotide monophosphatase NagD (HAD superfamily)
MFEHVASIVGPREIFVSHVVLRALSLGHPFEATTVEDYVDVGTIQAWTAFRDQQPTLFVDVDGVVFRNRGAFFGKLWSEVNEPLTNNIQVLKSLLAKGAQLIFVSARPELHREQLESDLRMAGLTWHALIMGCLHSRRYLVNDYAPSNPYPSAVAVNVRRDQDDLYEYFPGIR